jgi:hypothetical protein
VGVVVVLVGLLAARNIIAREVLLSWLRSRGVPAEADVGRLGLGGVTGRIVVGPPGHPDFSVETSEVAYGLWTDHGPGLEIRSVRLVHPVLNASWKGGRLSFGALDPLIEELRKRPPRPNARQPLIVVQGGKLLLATDYGRAEVAADAVVDNGKLLRLEARLAPTRLTVGRTVADLGGSSLSLTTHGDRVDIRLQAAATRLAGPAGELEAAQATLTGHGPYPDLKQRRADGALSLKLEAAAGGVQAGETRAKALRLTGTFDGRANGWIDTLAVAGYGDAEAGAAELDASDLHLGAAQAKFAARSLAWNRAYRRLNTDGRLDLGAATLTAGNLRLADFKAGLVGTGGLGEGGPRISGSGGFSTQGSIAGMGRPLKDDPAEVAAVKRALMGFAAAAPSVRVELAGERLVVALPAPLRIRAPSGAAVVVAGPPGRPIFQNGRGAFGVAAEGGGLPTATASVSGFHFTPGGIVAPMRLVVHSDFDPVRGGVLKTAGVLRAGAKETTFTADGCAQVQAQRLEFAQNDVLAPKGELCPSGGPLFRYAAGSWRVRGRFADASADAPFLQVKAAEGRGTASFGQTRGALVAQLLLQGARLEDAAKPYGSIRCVFPGPRSCARESGRRR